MSVLNHPFYAEAAHPLTPQARLAELAAAYPELHPVIASNPACYPGLLAWMREHGTLAPVAEQQAVAQQPVELPVEQPNPFGSTTVKTRPALGKKPLLIGGAIALVVLLVGGGTWAYAAISSKLGGASTPQAAVEKLLNGAADLDPLSVYGALSPAEVESFQASFEKLGELTTEAPDGAQVNYQKQLEEMMSLTQVSLDGLRFEVEEIDDEIAAVAVTGGELRVDADPEKLADAYFEMMKPQLIAQYTEWGFSDEEIEDVVDEARSSAVDGLADTFPYSLTAGEIGEEIGHDPTIIAVKEGNSWYVSPLLTMGELMYQSRGTGQPRGTLVAKAETFATPEEALDGFAQGAVEYLNTGEPAALARSLPLAERRLLSLYGEAAGLGQGLSLEVADVSASSVKAGDIARIELENLAISGGSGYRAWSVEVSGVCAQANGSSPACLDDVPLLDKLGAVDLQLIAVKQSSGWFVSPVRTVSDAAAIVMDNLVTLSNRGELEDLLASN
ncbi:hypothetical protein GCM10022381_41520 [Leifsonia kafniensis]|uniref:Leucine rich repeat variant domain-containing protein n=1 Tax=Leifsonia kafniensis TaxID=475957 RepID=A0ABP7L879_9MICO